MGVVVDAAVLINVHYNANKAPEQTCVCEGTQFCGRKTVGAASMEAQSSM